jgi:transcriptional regulator GlxA family with amidase domain
MKLQPYVVEIIAFDGCIAAEVFAIADMLDMANALAVRRNPRSTPPFTVSVVSTSGHPVRASAGVTLSTKPPARATDMLVVPGLTFTAADQLLDRVVGLTNVKRHIVRRARSNTVIASACVGAFLLADAGVLDGRRATTAWIVAGLFERRFPGVQLDVDQLMVRDGRVWTAGAVTAAYDLALQLVRNQCGAEFAAMLGKIALIGTDRALQSPFVLADLGGTSSELVTRACHKIRRGVDRPFDLDALATSCGASARTLNRRFQAELSCSPLQFAHKVKVERAKSLLETTRLRIQELPERLGYLDETTFRMIFSRHTGVTPQEYRRRFRRPAAEVDGRN